MKIPILPFDSSKESRLSLAQIIKVCWSAVSIQHCCAVAIEQVTFSTDFHGFLMMHSNVLGLRYEDPCTKIPI